MEEKKLSQYIGIFEFVKNGMLQLPKTVDNFTQLIDVYNKNKNIIIKSSSYRLLINNTEFEIKQTQKVVEKEQKMKMILIAAMDSGNLIAVNNKIPWKLSNDMKRFKETTLNHFILMGRKTFETFPKPLPNRIHVIISKNQIENLPDNCYCFLSIEKGIEFINNQEISNINQEKFFVIGGGEIYNQTIDLADELNITKVLYNFNKGGINEDISVFFPEINQKEWFFVLNDKHEKDEKNDYFYNFQSYIKKEYIPEIKINSSLTKKLIVNYFINKIK